MSRGGNVARSGSGLSGFVFVLPRASMERHERELVMDRRTRFRASWQDCAAMVDRSVHDVRVACDPDYRPGGEEVRSLPVAQPSRAILGAGSPHAKVMIGLSLALKRRARGSGVKDATVTAEDVAAMVDGLALNSVGNYLGRLQVLGMVRASGGNHSGQRLWRLTPMGEIEVATHLAAAVSH